MAYNGFYADIDGISTADILPLDDDLDIIYPGYTDLPTRIAVGAGATNLITINPAINIPNNTNIPTNTLNTNIPVTTNIPTTNPITNTPNTNIPTTNTTNTTNTSVTNTTNVNGLSRLTNEEKKQTSTDLLNNFMNEWNKENGIFADFKDERPEFKAYQHNIPTNKQFCLDSFELISANTLKEIYNLIKNDINSSVDKQTALVSAKPDYFYMYNNNLEYRIIKEILEKDPMQLAFVYMPDLELQKTAVTKNGLAIQFINNPSKEIMELAIKQNCEAVNYIDYDTNNVDEISLLLPLCKSYEIKNRYPYIKKPSQLMDIWMIWIQATDEIKKRRILTPLEVEIDIACKKRCDIQYTFPKLFAKLIELNEVKILEMFIALDKENMYYVPEGSLSYETSLKFMEKFKNQYDRTNPSGMNFFSKYHPKVKLDYVINRPSTLRKFKFTDEELEQIVDKKPIVLKLIRDTDFLLKMIRKKPMNMCFVNLSEHEVVLKEVKKNYPTEYEMYGEMHKSISLMDESNSRYGGL